MPPAVPAPQPCPNCGAEVALRFCPACGQERGRSPHVPLRAFLGEAASEALSLDSRMGRTLVPFFLRPGLLTAEYLAGRRTRYSSPLRLYLLTSILFFLLLSLHSTTGLQIRVSGQGVVVGPAKETAEQAEAEGPADDAEAEEALAQARAAGGLDALAAQRLTELRALPREEATRRVAQSVLAQAPRVLFFLVPVMALLLQLLFRRPRLYYAEHFVVALHAHALGFAALLPFAAAPRVPALLGAGVLAAALHLALALRRIYGQTRLATAVRLAALSFAYLVALSLGVAAATLLGLAFL